MTAKLTSEAIYHQIGALLASPPDLVAFDANYTLPTTTIQWLGRASALVRIAKPVGLDYVKFDGHVENLVATMNAKGASRQIILSLHRLLSELELQLPAASQGAFVSPGAQFDAFSAIARILGEAGRDVLIVDPYMDASAVVDFAGLAPEGVSVRLLTDQGSMKPALLPAADRWIGQYGTARPLQVRATTPMLLHDRLLIVDGSTAWILTQSLKDFAKRAPATIQRADPEMAAMKVAAFEAAWDGAEAIAPTPRQPV
ncbi:hypothetical protein [Brevundimonas sp. SL161]|uniref:hypothetical protein n=1 Tax=Brevundimonas sp. SL161 TaxID=2804613 RepID=UPI003CEB51A6